MNGRDRDLLDKQMRRVSPAPRNDGVWLLAMTSVFLAGMTLGAFMVAPKSEPQRLAADDSIAALAVPSSALPMAR